MKVINFEAKENMTATTRDRVAAHLSRGYKAITITENGKMFELVYVRIGATDSTCYACVWIHGADKWAYGGGKAGGYGYHKASAALAEAFVKAGVKFDESFSGCGNEAMKEAVKAVAEYIANSPVYVVEFYG